MTVSVRVDFNSITSDGLIKATVRRADGTVSVGDRIIVHDPLEDVRHSGRVTSVDPLTGRLLIEVQWARAVRIRRNTVTGGGGGHHLLRPIKWKVSGGSFVPQSIKMRPKATQEQ